ncbi:hypothetical protein [Microbacterium sp.]|uniref:hypothetical protein n=1 Tax=Microbacterium sp. TaxID=51671 RepID=UPI003C73529C
MTSDSMTDEAALFAAIRRAGRAVDPVPDDLADRMIAAVAMVDLGREYALLSLIASDATTAVRGDADMLTLQFSDGRTNMLVHVTAADHDRCRLDGWVDGDVSEVRLTQEDGEHTATLEGGRFFIDAVERGISRLRVLLAAAPEPGAPDELLTPRFEI